MMKAKLITAYLCAYLVLLVLSLSSETILFGDVIAISVMSALVLHGGYTYGIKPYSEEYLYGYRLEALHAFAYSILTTIAFYASSIGSFLEIGVAVTIFTSLVLIYFFMIMIVSGIVFKSLNFFFGSSANA